MNNIGLLLFILVSLKCYILRLCVGILATVKINAVYELILIIVIGNVRYI